jgi:hypothetical protein
MSLITQFKQLIADGRTGFMLGPDGIEVRPQGGYAVGYKRLRCIEEAVGLGSLVGYWKSPSGDEHVDLVEVFEGKATAIVAANTRNEAAIYDFTNGVVIDTRKSTHEEGIDVDPFPEASGTEQVGQGEAEGTREAE